MTAKIEKDHRSDALQLIAQGIKPLPEPLPGASVANASVVGNESPYNHGIGSFSRQPLISSAPKPIVLRLDVMQNAVSELQNIHDIVLRHPGRTPLVLSCRNVDGLRLEITASPRFSVEVADALLDELGPWL